MRVKTEERREHILKVASEVFLETGFERASMAEISARVGGSKATLYSYFPSKAALFVATTLIYGMRHANEAFSTLKPKVGGLASSLQTYGEHMIGLLCEPEIVRGLRMVIAESGESDVGRLFFKAGPQHTQDALSSFMALETEAGRLRPADPQLMSLHFAALLESETLMPMLFGVRQSVPKAEIKRIVKAAVSVFMAAYGADAASASTLPNRRSAGGSA